MPRQPLISRRHSADACASGKRAKSIEPTDVQKADSESIGLSMARKRHNSEGDLLGSMDVGRRRALFSEARMHFVAKTDGSALERARHAANAVLAAVHRLALETQAVDAMQELVAAGARPVSAMTSLSRKSRRLSGFSDITFGDASAANDLKDVNAFDTLLDEAEYLSDTMEKLMAVDEANNILGSIKEDVKRALDLIEKLRAASARSSELLDDLDRNRTQNSSKVDGLLVQFAPIAGCIRNALRPEIARSETLANIISDLQQHDPCCSDAPETSLASAMGSLMHALEDSIDYVTEVSAPLQNDADSSLAPLSGDDQRTIIDEDRASPSSCIPRVAGSCTELETSGDTAQDASGASGCSAQVPSGSTLPASGSSTSPFASSCAAPVAGAGLMQEQLAAARPNHGVLPSAGMGDILVQRQREKIVKAVVRDGLEFAARCASSSAGGDAVTTQGDAVTTQGESALLGCSPGSGDTSSSPLAVPQPGLSSPSHARASESTVDGIANVAMSTSEIESPQRPPLPTAIAGFALDVDTGGDTCVAASSASVLSAGGDGFQVSDCSQNRRRTGSVVRELKDEIREGLEDQAEEHGLTDEAAMGDRQLKIWMTSHSAFDPGDSSLLKDPTRHEVSPRRARLRLSLDALKERSAASDLARSRSSARKPKLNSPRAPPPVTPRPPPLSASLRRRPMERDGPRPLATDGSTSEACEKQDGSTSEACEKPDGSMSEAGEKPDCSTSEACEKPGGSTTEAYEKPDESTSEAWDKPGERLSSKSPRARRSQFTKIVSEMRVEDLASTGFREAVKFHMTSPTAGRSPTSKKSPTAGRSPTSKKHYRVDIKAWKPKEADVSPSSSPLCSPKTLASCLLPPIKKNFPA